jgi:hypothetical protein
VPDKYLKITFLYSQLKRHAFILIEDQRIVCEDSEDRIGRVVIAGVRWENL